MIVAPSSAVAPTDGALADVDIFRKSGNSDCDCAAMAAGAERRICRHVVLLVKLEYYVVSDASDIQSSDAMK